MESHLPYFNLLIKELIDLSLDTANARIAETFTLPSKGIIYEEQVDPEIILGSMKTKHEMMRLSASENNNKIMADIIDDCLVGNNVFIFLLYFLFGKGIFFALFLHLGILFIASFLSKMFLVSFSRSIIIF